jgi:hypothetical protein
MWGALIGPICFVLYLFWCWIKRDQKAREDAEWADHRARQRAQREQAERAREERGRALGRVICGESSISDMYTTEQPFSSEQRPPEKPFELRLFDPDRS